MTEPEEGFGPTVPASGPDDPDSQTKCGLVAILGAPNVGKSTLLNRLVGAKVSIVSPKVQTTRTRVLGIVPRGPTQVIFVDTPGIFSPRRRLDRAMVGAAWGGAADADAVLLMVDAARGVDADTRAIIDRLKQAPGRTVLVALNKVDLLAKPKLLALAAALDAEGLFEAIFMISATTGDGIDGLIEDLAGRMRPGPWLFPEDQLSDMPMRLLAAEITREKLYLQLAQELPYAATVETERWEERPDGSAAIEQVIYIRRTSQRAIVLGKGGSRIKAIGAAARQELEAMLEQRVHLFLFVKVRDKWEDDPERYREWGLDFDA